MWGAERGGVPARRRASEIKRETMRSRGIRRERAGAHESERAREEYRERNTYVHMYTYRERKRET